MTNHSAGRKFKETIFFLLACITLAGFSPANAADEYHWVGNYYYQNDFNTQAELNDWKLTEYFGNGNWSLTTNSSAFLQMDNSSLLYFYELSLEKNGEPVMLPLNKMDGIVTFKVLSVNGSSQKFSLEVEEYRSNGTYITSQILLSDQNSAGTYTLNLKNFNWNSKTDQIRFIISGYNISFRDGSIEFDFFHYKHSDDSWNNKSNWSLTAGGPGGAGVPKANDNVYFDGIRPANCTIDLPVNISSLTIAQDYTGTIVQGNKTILIQNSATFSGGTFTGGTGNITITGAFTLSGNSVFTATSGTMELRNNTAFNGGTFNHNNGTVRFNTALAEQDITGQSPVFYNAEFIGTGQHCELLSSGNIIVVNNLQITGSQAVSLNSGTFEIKGNLNVTISAPNCQSDVTMLFSGTGNQSITSMNSVLPGVVHKMVVNKPSGTLTLTKPVTVSDDFILMSGTVDAGTSTLDIEGNFAIQGGTFSAGSSTLIVKGNFTNNKTFNPGSSTVIFDGNGSLSGSSVTSFKNIVINGDLSAAANFNVAGDFTNNKSFNAGNGTITFNGATSATQHISGSAVTNFNNITVNNTKANPGVSVQSNQNLRGILRLSANASMDADGDANTSVFKLISTSDSPVADASIDVLPANAKIMGNVTVERFMTIEGESNGRIYRYISSPVSNATVADIQNEIPITGSFTGKSTCKGCSGQSMFEYAETIIHDANKNGKADSNDGYIDFPQNSNDEILMPGKGYALFVRGNIMASAKWDVRGPVNHGNSGAISFPVTFTSSGVLAEDGWNLVGNPYPSAIDWSASSGWTKSNIDATIYIRDNGSTTPQFAAWNGVVGVNGGSRYIAMGQAFWVKANGNGTPGLRATENVKKAGAQTTFFREETPENLLRITLSNGVTRDETAIHFREDATNDLDSHADAVKMPNSTFNLSTIASDGSSLAINSLSNVSCGSAVNLNIENTLAGNYSLEFSDYESFTGNVTMTLQDNYTNKSVNIRSGAAYNFTISADPLSYGSNRFKISFDIPQLNELNITSSDICTGSDALLHIKESQQGVTYSTYMNSRQISFPVSGTGSEISIAIPADSLSEGKNIITITSATSLCNSQVSKDIELLVVEKPKAVSTQSGKSCREGEVTLTASGAPLNGYYNWYNAETTVTPLENHSESLKTGFLAKSKTYYVAAVNALGCEGPRVPVQAEVVYYDDVELTFDGDSLTTNYNEGNQWYFNHEKISQETSQSIKVQQSGYYSVEVNINGCTTSAGYDYLVTGIENNDEFNIRVFPNPVVNELYIELPASVKNLQEIRLMNSAGQVVEQTLLSQENEKKTGRFEMTSRPSGVYIVKAGNYEAKVVKR